MNRETSFSSSDTLVVVDRSKRRRNIIIAAVVGIVVLVAAVLYFTAGGKSPDSDAAAVQVPNVSVVVPGRTDVARVVTASGPLAARHDQPVGVAGEGGMVRAVLVEAGAWVRQGQVLATVDRSVQSQNIAQLAAQVQVARADAALAQNEFERSESLVGRGFVSKADLDRKKAARDAATARIRVAEANLNAMRAQLGRLDIRAPKSGLILSRNVEVGQVVSQGSGALFHLAENGQMEMKAQLSQQDLAFIQVGMPAQITPIGSGRSFTGQVWQVAPMIDATNRQGEVRIAIPYDQSIRPGGFAEAKIQSGATSAPLLPQSAVLSDDNGNYVYVINGKNEVERRAIKIGTVEDQGVTIAEGISGNERVVLSAGPFLNPGQKVKAQVQASR
jgi:RND family efflux transporter MFP subunit